MSNRDKPSLKTVSSRIEVKEYEDMTVYAGSKEDLLTAGVALEEMFPIGRKRRSFCRLAPDALRIVTEEDEREVSEREGYIPFGYFRGAWVRKVKGGSFRVIINRTKEQRDHRRAQVHSAEAFANEAREQATIFLRCLEVAAKGELRCNDAGFRLHNQEEIMRHVRELRVLVAVSVGLDPRPSMPSLTVIKGGKAVRGPFQQQ